MGRGYLEVFHAGHELLLQEIQQLFVEKLGIQLSNSECRSFLCKTYHAGAEVGIKDSAGETRGAGFGIALCLDGGDAFVGATLGLGPVGWDGARCWRGRSGGRWRWCREGG